MQPPPLSNKRGERRQYYINLESSKNYIDSSWFRIISLSPFQLHCNTTSHNDEACIPALLPAYSAPPSGRLH